MASLGKTCIEVFKILFYLAFGLAIPIACIVIGGRYDGDCPKQPYIITYLYVAGAFCMAKGILNLVFSICNLCGNCEEGGPLCCWLVADSILGLFLFAWFITGSVWVYRIHDKFSTDPADAPDYCDETLYNFTFGILTTQWVLWGLAMLLSCLAKCCGGE